MKLVKDLRGHLHTKKTGNKRKKRIITTLVLSMVMSMMFCSLAFASGGTSTTGLDESVFTTIFNACKTFMGLFSIFPINIFLGASLVGVVVGVIKKFKKA